MRYFIFSEINLKTTVMNRFFAALTFTCCATLAVQAQTNNDPPQGNVRVTQSDDISNIVNGPKKQEPVAQPETPVTPVEQPSGSDVTPPVTEHHESSESAEANEKPRERRPDREKEKEKKIKEVEYKENKGDPVDTSKKVMKDGRKMMGYRVQIFSGGNTREDRLKAEQIGNEVKKRLPSQPVYVHFISPRWTVRIGNFRKQEHASSLLKTMKKFGYRQACIVKGVVNIKRR